MRSRAGNATGFELTGPGAGAVIGTLVSTIRTQRQFGSRYAFIVWSGALAWLLAACGKKGELVLAEAPPETQSSGGGVDTLPSDTNVETSGGASTSSKVGKKPSTDEEDTEPDPDTTGSTGRPDTNPLIRSSSFVPEFDTQTYPIELIDIERTDTETYPIEYARVPGEPVRVAEPRDLVVEIVVPDAPAPAIQTVEPTTVPENTVPVAVADIGAIQEDGVEEGSDAPPTLHGNLLSNDTDADADTKLSVVAMSGGSDDGPSITTVGAFGTLAVNKATGDYSYTLHNNETGVQSLAQDQTVTDTFTYTIGDGQGGTATSTLTVTITGQNDAPAIEVEHHDFDAAETLVALERDLSTIGRVVFSDVDRDDTPTASVTDRQITLVGAEISPDTRAAVEQAFSIIDPASGEWAFNLSAENVPFLSASELQAIYTVAITDGAGAVVTQDVTITLVGGQEEPPPQGGWLL